MLICPKCGKKISGADKIKVKGVWRHHHTSIKKLVRDHVKLEGIVKSENLSDDQLIRRAVESGQIK